MKTTRPSLNRTPFLVYTLLLLVLCMSRPADVRAQWTTPNASQNINNTNTGNVGVGTTTPAYKLEVSNSVDKAQFRFGMGSSDTGGYLFSNGPLLRRPVRRRELEQRLDRMVLICKFL